MCAGNQKSNAVLVCRLEHKLVKLGKIMNSSTSVQCIWNIETQTISWLLLPDRTAHYHNVLKLRTRLMLLWQ